MNRRRGGNFGILMLGASLIIVVVENIPPVTLGLIIGQSAIFLDVFHKMFPSAYGVCMSSYLVYQHRDWHRMILATFYHGDDMHLYFNMVSLLYKGLMLERMFGSPYFAYLVSVFTVLTSATYVGMGMILGQALHASYYTSCAVGFSGVLFALKVLATEYSPRGTQYVFGFIPIPFKDIFWAELVLIQLIAPNASFVGHLAGILVGLTYTRGPLKPLMDSFLAPGPGTQGNAPRSGHRAGFSPFGQLFRGFGSNSHQSSGSQVYGSGYARPSAPSEEDIVPDEIQGQRFEPYTGGLSEDEQIRIATEESMWQTEGDFESDELQRALQESVGQQQQGRNTSPGRQGNAPRSGHRAGFSPFGQLFRGFGSNSHRSSGSRVYGSGYARPSAPSEEDIVPDEIQGQRFEPYTGDFESDELQRALQESVGQQQQG